MAQDLNNIKFPILNFVKNLVSKTMYLAFKKILNPCCTLSTTASWSCTGTNLATLTLTLNRSTNLLAKGTYKVNVANGSTVRNYSGTFTDGSTISIASVATPAGGGSVTISGDLFLPTDNDSQDVGVFISLNPTVSTAPSCP